MFAISDACDCAGCEVAAGVGVARALSEAAESVSKSGSVMPTWRVRFTEWVLLILLFQFFANPIWIATQIENREHLSFVTMPFRRLDLFRLLRQQPPKPFHCLKLFRLTQSGHLLFQFKDAH